MAEQADGITQGTEGRLCKQQHRGRMQDCRGMRMYPRFG